MTKISEVLGKVIESILYFFMIILVSATFLQVFCRFVVKTPISWSQELVKLCFIWIIFLGAAIAVREQTHLTMDIIVPHLPGGAQKMIRGGIYIMSVVCALFMLYGGIGFCIQCSAKKMMTLPLPADAQYIAMPISAGLMIWYLIEKAWLSLTHRKEGA
ncbi:TRAP transporter small permease [Laedolimicola ammoniilytica]|uniref:TRAP transporter small permease n=1 Tax=Laedolimicola ammoniilytica TaxID=2981771 RepID=A0ABT2S0P5_9FIRM|nr:TRAP transporter small permease [Laedolimicola ammoniilytica]MCU6698047.1 TRAP transporter small permease [Laedolimicola ammoniilytica]SCI60468.1 Neu5Ac permease [uncultured Clostridium sp.]